MTAAESVTMVTCYMFVDEIKASQHRKKASSAFVAHVVWKPLNPLLTFQMVRYITYIVIHTAQTLNQILYP